MAQQISGAKKLIDERGGYRVVAIKLGWPITTVHTFARTNQAPPYRWTAIEALPIAAKVKPPKPNRPKRRRPADPSSRREAA